MDIRFAGIEGTWSSSSRTFYITQTTPCSSPRIHPMSSRRNQSSAFRHYIPDGRKYHIQFIPPSIPPPPARTGGQPYPPPQIYSHHSGGAHTKLRNIKPVPSTTSSRDSKSSQQKKKSSAHGGSSSQKQYKFIQYPPR